MNAERFLRLPEVETTIGLKRAQLYALAKAGLFPRPIKLGAHASGWLQSEIADWMHARVRASRPGSEEQR